LVSNPFYDENGNATQYLLRLKWRAVFTECFNRASPTYHQWIDTKDFTMLGELAEVMLDVASKFKNLDARERAAIFLIRAIRELRYPQESDLKRISFARFKKLALSLWAADEPPKRNETFREKRRRLERMVTWDSLRRTLFPNRFNKPRRGRPLRSDDVLAREAYLSLLSVDVTAPAAGSAPLYEMLGLDE
jgi:hypothetical protein